MKRWSKVGWPFLADGAFTILRRLKNRENILKAHRSHLYQRLVIAGRSHRQVTLVYGALALIGAVLAWWVLAEGEAVRRLGGEAVTRLGREAGLAVLVVAILFAGLWRWVVVTERRRPSIGEAVRR